MQKENDLKILFVCDGIIPFVVGGMQKHSAGLVKALLDCGASITLVHCVYEGAQMPQKAEVLRALSILDSEKIEIITKRFPQGSNLPGHYLKSSYLFSQLIFDEMKGRLGEFDFIYTKGFTGWEFIAKRKTVSNMPKVGVKFHGYEMFQSGGSLAMRLKKWMLRGPVRWNSINADIVFSYGSKISQIIQSIGVSNSKIVEIPTAIDDTWLNRTAKEKRRDDVITFLFVGRYERRKGVEELSRAIETRVISNKVRFEFIGPIPHSKRLKREDVFYHGEVKDFDQIVDIFDKADVLLCPSYAEGMPNVIMEAMSRGLYIVATDVGATNLMVTEGLNGRLIQPRSIEQLSKNIDDLVRMNKRDLNAAGAKGVGIVKEKYTWKIVGEQTYSCIKKICRNA
jgi:glycosyltransferase involved in cell wall biosynthesis